MRYRANVSIDCEKVQKMREATSNFSALIEEALLYFDYAIRTGLIAEHEKERLINAGLIKSDWYK